MQSEDDAPEEIRIVNFAGSVPRINNDGPLATEAQAIDQLNFDLSMLSAHVDHFHYAVSLLEHCSETLSRHLAAHDVPEIRTVMGWHQIAARDATMTVSHFSKLLTRIKGLGKRCPLLWEHVNSEHLKAARRLFDQTFPGSEAHRNVVGHAGEMLWPAAVRYSEDGPPAQAPGWTGSVGGIFMSTAKDGRMVRCEISQMSAERLSDAKAQAFRAFEDAVAFFR